MKKAGSIIFLVTLIFSACTEEIPTQVVEQAPHIVLLQAPPTVYQFPAQPAGIHVRVSDGQGAGDVAGVTLSVMRLNGALINTREMADDGRSGDIVAADGQFYAAIDTALLHNQTGAMVFEAVARDKSQNLSAAARDTVQILGGVENRLPSLASIIAPQSVYLDTNFVYIFSASAGDPDGAHTVRFVLMETYPPAYARPARVDTLRDNGLNGDAQAGDGNFSVGVTGPMIGALCGWYSLVFRPVDDANGTGTSEGRTMRATRLHLPENTPPRVSGLIAPASISRSAVPNTYLLSIRAEDPDVECDDAVTRVFFNSYLPNGNASRDNPFVMRDDGQLGDEIAGDGRYSITIQIPPDATTGAYRFEFQAQDRSGGTSSKIIHTITVTP